MARETTTPGTLSTTALLGAANGPQSVMMAVANGAPFTANSPGFGIPTLSREFEPTYHKHQSSVQVGRRFADVAVVQGRRETMGQFSVQVMPDSFGQLLFLLFGADTVTAGSSGTLTGAANTANALTLTVSALSAAVVTGQRIYISDGAISEYVQAAAPAIATATSITITGGGGTGGGLKSTHAAATAVQYGPWSHVYVPSNSANGIPTFTVEDNLGGHANSLIYPACSLTSMELSAPIENDTEALTASFKVVGQAPVNPAGLTGSGGFTLPAEEVPIAAGNACTFTATGATLPSAPFNNVYVPDYKMTIDNNAKLVKASAGSPDPYTSIVTNFSCRGNMETVFEGYQTFQDYYNLNIWQNATFLHTWGTKAMFGSTGSVAAALTMVVQRMAITKANKQQAKDDIVRLPIESFAGQDYSDFGGTNGPVCSMTLTSNIAVY